jgi:hypothetical protein
MSYGKKGVYQEYKNMLHAYDQRPGSAKTFFHRFDRRTTKCALKNSIRYSMHGIQPIYLEQ